MEGAAGELVLSHDEVDSPQFDFVFNMKDFLPPALHTPFLAAVTEFVWLPWREAMRAGAAVEGATQGGSQAARDAAASVEAQVAWLRQQLPTRFTEKLLKQVCVWGAGAGGTLGGIYVHAGQSV